MAEAESVDGTGVPVGRETEERRTLYAAVSREMVQLYKDQFGREPTEAKTSFAEPDVLICTLKDTLTPAERTSAPTGGHQRMRDIRSFFQQVTEPELREVVEHLTKRRVRAFISGIDVE